MNANIIKRTLQNFGIEVEMDEITVGPTVTRYALKPAEGVKLSRIVALQNDLSLALAAHPASHRSTDSGEITRRYRNAE
jgi:S-DNA-T family DNA segregation ATPase FtsK/SpoIIIE